MVAMVPVPGGVVPIHAPRHRDLGAAAGSRRSPVRRSGPASPTPTSTLSVVFAVADTLGAAGVAGFSATSVTFTVTSIVAVPPLLSSAFTRTA